MDGERDWTPVPMRKIHLSYLEDDEAFWNVWKEEFYFGGFLQEIKRRLESYSLILRSLLVNNCALVLQDMLLWTLV